jgi:Family of unknown function (DUF5706)
MRARASGGRHGDRPAIGLGLSSAPEPDQAWKVLAVVNDSVRHAENKGAVVLGAAGVIGSVLYTLAGNRAHPGTFFDAAAATCGACVIAAATFAGLCLIPRLRSRDEPKSLVYFHHIARRHRGVTGSADYERSLRSLLADSSLLLEDLAAQIWANTQVAERKYRMIKVGLIALMLAILALAVTSIIAVVSVQ